MQVGVGFHTDALSPVSKPAPTFRRALGGAESAFNGTAPAELGRRHHFS
jgi:hypothetical protein